MSSPFAKIPPARPSLVRDELDGADVPAEDDRPLDVDVEATTEAPEWTHETVEFLGDTLQVRKPTQQAMAAFSLSTSKYVAAQMRNDMTGLFISRHLSPSSYERVFGRLMDPDDESYTVETIGNLMRAIVELTTTP